MNEPQNNEIAAAKTLDGVNIHLGFIVQTMTEMKQDIKETKNQVSALKDSFVTSTVFSDHLKYDEDHEQRIRKNSVDIETIRAMIDKKYDALNTKIAWYAGGLGGAGIVIQFIGWYLTFKK